MLLALVLGLAGCAPAAPPADGPHVVFVIGEREYETARTLPAFARAELEPRGFRTTFVHADEGDPNAFPGLEALDSADLLVLSVRRRTPRPEVLDRIRAYLAGGGPLVALRTASHAFALRNDDPPAGHVAWPAFDTEILGGRYEGHYDNPGSGPGQARAGTDIAVEPRAARHPILTGVDVPAFRSGGTLYRSRDLSDAAATLLTGRTLDDGEPVSEPVAWTHTAGGRRVFYTSLGHPADFDEPAFRRVLLNAVYWALDRAPPPPESVAGTEEAARFLEGFEGRGAQTDDSLPTPPEEALAAFRHPADLVVELAAAEPLVHQPVSLGFDHRGRLWVVQYNQYPYPEGLKVVGTDHHLRARFDRTPAPPPEGTRGADRITFLEDTDGDGRYDRATDAVTGLNIATSVLLGRGRIWVLNPPYLLAYPDPDGDGLPDGEPVVHLTGFGLEDTHAVANSLRWGPDGWIYGAQGSTTTADVSSAVTKHVRFSGQGIWRYHPETQVFELFAEGGGNTFYVEIDDKGRIYSGHNGGEARGQHYRQGAYYVKNWGKHGALTNPYAFGFFPHMALDGDRLRFTHGFIRYGGGALPDRYTDALIAINPLHNFVQLGRFAPHGSTFRTADTERVLETDDHWFRPVDIQAGPDGAVYLADWYDSRLSHVDPRDTWHRASGRIYRLRGAETERIPPFDLSKASTDSLIALLGHENRWFRRQALRQFGDRKDAAAVPELRRIVETDTGQRALEALWALHLSGGFDAAFAAGALEHADPHVRRWTVRLLGDARAVSPDLAARLAALAAREPDAEVRAQLAASARRLPGPAALPILDALLRRDADADDPHIPLLVWWALEAHAESDREGLTDLFADPALWERRIVRETVLQRVMQRYVMAGGSENLAAASTLLERAPDAAHARPLVAGLQEGLRGRDAASLPEPLLAALDRYREDTGIGSVALDVRQRKPEAVRQALDVIADASADLGERIALARVFGEVEHADAWPVLLEAGTRSRSGALRQAALHALRRYDEAEIGKRVTAAYPDNLRADPDVRLAALELLASRPAWARDLADAVDRKRVDPADVPVQIVQQLKRLGDPAVDAVAASAWPHVRAHTPAELQARIDRVAGLLKAEPGDPAAGRAVFASVCGTCHALFGEGGTIGPDLTGYDRDDLDTILRNTVDPNAAIREGYVNHLVRTRDGRTLAGVVTARSGGTVTLRALSGEETTLPDADIAALEPQAVSLMPEGLLDPLSDRQIRDLFAYLEQAAPSPP